ALGIERGLIVVTRADLAPGAAPEVISRARRELAGTGLAHARAVVTSARESTGLDTLVTALDDVLAAAEAAPGQDEAPLRLWIDRAFSISGAGTVVTGTLGAGGIGRGDRLALHAAGGTREVQVRGVQ